MAFNFLLCLQKKHSKSGEKIKTMLEKRGEHRFAVTLQTAPLSIRTASLAGRGAISIKTVYFAGRGVIFEPGLSPAAEGVGKLMPSFACWHCQRQEQPHGSPGPGQGLRPAGQSPSVTHTVR